jgi:hypothetical protein
MNTKVAILGKLPTKFKAPFDDKEWDIWACNCHKEELPRITRWFDIHANNPNPNADITRDNYPFKEVEKMLCGQYINNSFSYMIAYAVLKGYKEIKLFGARFLNDSERRTHQYTNVRELCFFARGRGVKVSAPYDEVILKEYDRYGV